MGLKLYSFLLLLCIQAAWAAADFVVITPPKCGTYLLSRALSLITGKFYIHYTDYYLYDCDAFIMELQNCSLNNEFIHTHLPPDEALKARLKALNYKILTILRDPRDQLISAIHFIVNDLDTDHLFNVPLEEFKALTFHQQIEELMTGELFGFQIFDSLYRRHYGWLDGETLVIKFEDLVGPPGGGNGKKRLMTLYKIANFIEESLTPDQAYEIANQLFGNTATFRSGQIGDWQKAFTQEQKLLFDKLYGEDLTYLGYPLYKDLE